MAGLAHNQYDLSSGISMHVAEQGDGLPVIMCHGWPEHAFSWRHQIEPLAGAGYHVIAPNQRGRGAEASLEHSGFTFWSTILSAA